MGQRQRERRALGAGWAGQAQSVFLGLSEWRTLHPQATLAEIEAEMDRRLAVLRADLLTDLALASRAAVLPGTDEAGARPSCRACGEALHAEGRHTRTLQTFGQARVSLERDYATCPRCGSGTFPPG